MAYKNSIAGWNNVELTEKEISAVRAIIEGAFKRAGGRGETGPVATKNILKGELGFDAARFTAGNVAADDETAKVAKAWAEAIAAGHAKLADLDAWPQVQKMAATMLKPALPALPSLPALPALPAMPAAKVGAAHGVTIVRKRRAA